MARMNSYVWIIPAALGLAPACGTSEIDPQRDGGSGDAAPDADPCDLDGDHYIAASCGGDDCDDANPEIHPGAKETCDGDDNDCDGAVDPDDMCDCAEPPAEPALPFADRVCLKGGWFWMGMARTDPHAAKFGYSTTPERHVFVSPYYMDQYEVTNRRFIACLDAQGCTIDPPATGAPWDRDEHATPEELDKPFLGASAEGAGRFCAWAGGALPTEAQWERAATGLGDEPRPYPHGYELPMCDQEYTRECVMPPPAPLDPVFVSKVGENRVANPEGLYDLGGNASEYAADVYSFTFLQDCPEPCKNPCFGCAGSSFGPPPGEEWIYGHAKRGRYVYDFATDSPEFSRNQYREFQWAKAAELAFADVIAQGFRCAYPAKPKR